MKILICTIGLPRSGKTTWAVRQGFPIVSPDAIRVTLHGKRYDKDYEEEVWVMARQMVRALFRAGNDIVILDACNTTKNRRDPWSSCPDGEQWETVFKIIDTSKEVCLDRAKRDKDDYIVPIIERMAAQLEYPTSERLWVNTDYGTAYRNDPIKIPGVTAASPDRIIEGHSASGSRAPQPAQPTSRRQTDSSP